MASELKVDKFTGVTTAGSIAVTAEGNSTTTNLQQGLGKVWCHCSQSTPSIDDSLNSASLTDDGTGLSTINFTNSMGNASYSAHCTHHDNIKNAAVGAFALTSFRLDSRNDAGTFADQSNICGTVHGDLA
mgnify:CR=1 FL=1